MDAVEQLKGSCEVTITLVLELTLQYLESYSVRICGTQPALLAFYCRCVGWQVERAHAMGAMAVSWAPATPPGCLLSAKPPSNPDRRLVSCGCDNTVRVSIGSHD